MRISDWSADVCSSDLFVRHHLIVVPPVAEAHAEAARAQGRARFEQFIEQLARHLQRGRHMREAIDELIPAEDAFAPERGELSWPVRDCAGRAPRPRPTARCGCCGPPWVRWSPPRWRARRPDTRSGG